LEARVKPTCWTQILWQTETLDLAGKAFVVQAALGIHHEQHMGRVETFDFDQVSNGSSGFAGATVSQHHGAHIRLGARQGL
jgi:hypothetical protein